MKKWELKAATMFVASVLFVLLISVVTTMAQTTGSIGGEVTDSKGAVVPNATVKVKNEATGVEITTTSNGNGIFQVGSLLPGNYTITTSATGFKKSVKTGVTVVVGTTNPGDVTLEPGSQDAVVTVTSSGETVLETETSQVSSTINTRQVQDLPSNGAGGGIDTLALLIPGVVANRVGGTNTNGTGLSVNGNRGRSNNFQIDGADNNDLSVGGPALFVDFQDAVQEFQVVSSNFDASIGRNQGAIINIVTKSGTNQFHGSGFVHHQDNVFFNSLRNTERRTTPITQLNPSLYTVYGGTIGGPIYLPTIGDNGPALTRLTNKAFFFFAYQGIRNPALNTGASLSYAITASDFGRLSATFPGNPVINAITTYSPFAIPTGVAINTISAAPLANAIASQINTRGVPGCPTVVPVGTLAPTIGSDGVTPCGAYIGTNPSTGSPFLTGGPYDVLNFGTAANPVLFQAAQYQRTLSQAYQESYYNIKIDVHPTNKDSIAWRFQNQSGNSINGNGTFSNATTVNVPAHSKNTGGNWTHTFSNTTLNDFRLNYQIIGVEFGGNQFCAGSIRNPGCVPPPGQLDKALTNIAFTAALGVTTGGALGTIGPATNLPQGRIGKVYQAADTLTKIWGRHSVRFGAEFKYLDTLVPFLPTFNGAYTFSGTTTGLPTGSALASRIINNAPSAFSVAVGNPLVDFIERDKYVFVQDDFKFRPNLTLNLGVRYENTGQPINQLNTITTNRENSSTPLFNPNLPLSARTVPKIPTDNNNFAPRIGFAYTPHFWKKLFGEDQTVFRGGYSIAYETAFYNLLLNVATAAPAAATLTVPTASLPATPGGPAGLTGSPFGDIIRANAAATGVLPVGILNPAFLTVTRDATNFKAPYSEQYSFGMQRQFGRHHIAEVRYVGTHGISLFQSINDNFFIEPLFDGFSLTRARNATGNGTGGIGVTTPFTGSAGQAAGSPNCTGATATQTCINFPNFRNLLPASATRALCTDIVGTLDNEAACNFRQFNAAGITTRNNSGSSIYNSLQAQYHGRFLKDTLSMGASYTWSKTIDNVSEVFGFADISSPNAQNPFCINQCERSLSNLDRPHAFSMNFVYDVPYFKEQRGIVGHLLGGWQLNGTYIITSGSPYTPANNVAGTFGLGSTYLTAGDRAFLTNPNAPRTAVGISQIDAFYVFGVPCNPSPCTLANTGFWSMNDIRGRNGAVPLNTLTPVTTSDVRYIINGPGSASIFGTPFGNAPRNSERGPIINQMNLSVFKNIKVRETFSVQLRAEAFNALNHPNVGTGVERGGPYPVELLTSAGVNLGAFGQNTDIALSRRVIQVGIRLVF